jgi:DNA-binding MarR family transcriptional regulator
MTDGGSAREIPEKLTGNTAFMLFHTALAYQVHFDTQMQSLRLTRAQWMVLSYLYFCNGINQTELAEVMEIGKVGVGRVAQKLERAGWIRREPDPVDGRAVNLFITPVALPIVKNLVDLQILESTHSLRDFSPEEVETLRDYLRRIRHNLTELSPPAEWIELKERTLEALDSADL